MGDQAQRWQIHLTGDTSMGTCGQRRISNNQRHLFRQLTLTAVSVMQESITRPPPLRQLILDVTLP
eukprot:6157804-Heterocapsa_arctica.AAC.1